MNIMTVDAAEALSRKAHDRFESLRAHSRTRSTTSDKWSRTDLNGSTLMATMVARVGACVQRQHPPGGRCRAVIGARFEACSGST